LHIVKSQFGRGGDNEAITNGVKTEFPMARAAGSEKCKLIWAMMADVIEE